MLPIAFLSSDSQQTARIERTVTVAAIVFTGACFPSAEIFSQSQSPPNNNQSARLRKYRDSSIGETLDGRLLRTRGAQSFVTENWIADAAGECAGETYAYHSKKSASIGPKGLDKERGVAYELDDEDVGENCGLGTAYGGIRQSGKRAVQERLPANGINDSAGEPGGFDHPARRLDRYHHCVQCASRGRTRNFRQGRSIRKSLARRSE